MSAPAWQPPWQSRKFVRVGLVTFILVAVWYKLTARQPEWSPHLQTYFSKGTNIDTSDFEPLHLRGYVNTGYDPGRNCRQLEYQGEIQVQESFSLDDNLVTVAEAVKGHPMIDYSGQDKSWTWEETVNKTWTRLSGSSVWLESHGVFLGITRVMFYDKGVKHWSVMSFLRGQIYDLNWNELCNYTIEWQGDKITFPTVFNIPSPYQEGDAFFGPEDPRIIIEQGVKDAEPIVVFNMISDLKAATRAMHVFRPFSNGTTILTINNRKERELSEKNWAPFFHNEHDKRYPSHFLHFIYDFNPLIVLKCHILNGWCDIVYRQKDEITGLPGRVSGGTQLVPLPIKSKPGLHVYVGMPRSHISAGCKLQSVYRPELMVLTARGNEFHLTFMSDSIDFGAMALDEDARSDPCGQYGRILIANSIAKWERSGSTDVMTVAFSVGDSTVQAIRLAGVAAFIQTLPLLGDSTPSASKGDDEMYPEWSETGQVVLACAIEAAGNYSIAIAKPVHGWAKNDNEEDKKWWMEENDEEYKKAREKEKAEEKERLEAEQKLLEKQEAAAKKLAEERKKNLEEERKKAEGEDHEADSQEETPVDADDDEPLTDDG